jgi:hypothetical protein
MPTTIKEKEFGIEIDFPRHDDLIKIKVIKRKHLEQIDEAKSFPLEGTRFVGVSGVWIVFQISTPNPAGFPAPVWQLRKIRDTDFVMQAVSKEIEGMSQEEYQERVEDIRESVWDFLGGLDKLFSE